MLTVACRDAPGGQAGAVEEIMMKRYLYITATLMLSACAPTAHQKNATVQKTAAVAVETDATGTMRSISIDARDGMTGRKNSWNRMGDTIDQPNFSGYGTDGVIRLPVITIKS